MKGKKLLGIVFLVIVFLVGGIFLASKLRAYTATDANGLTWYFSISGGKATNVYLYSGSVSSLTTLEIPRTLTYNGTEYPVTSLRGYGTSTSTSSSYRRNIIYGVTRATSNSTITKIIIPDTVTSIGINTFANFTGLTSFVVKDSLGNETEGIPQNLTTIGSFAFYGCRNMSVDIVIPDTVTSLGTYAFYNNSKIKSLKIGTGITAIPDYCFYNCSTIDKIEIPSNITSIGYYAFSNCSLAKTITIPDTVTSIGNYGFSSCRGITEIKIPAGITTIGNYVFSGCSGLKTVEIPNNITSIGMYAFSSCTGLEKVTLGTGVTSIGNNAFYYCSKLETINFPESLKTIGNNAFYNCTSLKGDITVPDSVTSLGSGAFNNCTGIDGVLKIGTGVKTIQGNTFYNCTNAKKIVLGSGVTSVASYSCTGLTDLWIENTEENVTIASYIGGQDSTVNIHWLNCAHKVNIATPADVKLINVENDEELTTNNFECDSTLKFKVVDEGNSDNLVLTIVKNGDFENATVVTVDKNETYEIDRIITECEIIVQDIAKGTDLSLRTFISQVNRVKMNTSREPVIVSNNGKIEYKHTKYPVSIRKGDLVTYILRVYNEGSEAGIATEIDAHIPEGLTYVSDNRINQKYGWVEGTNGKISTDYLKDTEINKNAGNLKLDYYDIELVLEVTEDISSSEDKRLVVLAEIGAQNTSDADSTPGNASSVESDYKKEESNNSTTSTYIPGNEDDDDFDSVILIGKIKVDYTIKINKIDAETDELLAGAKFNLLDSEGNILKTCETSEDGTLDFGMITTYGEGEDVYYIEEANAPEGYTVLERSKIKVVVIKTLENEETREYSVNVVCDVLDYNLDTTRYEYTPIYTKEQLAKIGSGEVVTIDGVNYNYNIDSNYKLMADIDLAGEEWTPIPYMIKGILNGDGHKISNLTITADEAIEISEIGLFERFSGIIENVNLENVNINISTISEEAKSVTGYPCVGAFAGFMSEGTIRNCEVSGNITAITDNIGGFIGHTANGYMIKIQNSINNANVTGGKITVDNAEVTSSNVGGFIGCALGAVSVTDCTNNGTIVCSKYNAGGIVGYVKATNYHEVNIKADFSKEDKMITLVVENNKTSGQYAIELENLDAKTLGLIEGAKYKILDKDKNVMPGCEEVELTSGSLRVATVNIKNLGVDTYYIEEIKPAEGYNKTTGIIKLEVRRYWDTETESFKVSVNAENLSDDEVSKDEPKEDSEPSSSLTGEIFAKVDFENVSWNVNKAEFDGCINNGFVVSNYMNAAGIVGTAHCIVDIDDCINKGNVVSGVSANAAGIIAELHTEDNSGFAKILNCKNEGTISSDSKALYGATAAIAANVRASLEVTNTENTGTILGSAVSGAIGDFNGILIMDGCINRGEISSIVPTSDYGNVNAPAGGMLAKNYVNYYSDKNENQIYIKNCENTGNVSGDCHTGGLIGLCTSSIVSIEDSNVSDCKVVDLSAGDKGGIIGFDGCNKTIIMNCNVDNVELERASTHRGSTYGTTGGIIGNFCVWTGGADTIIESIKVINCKVTDSDITAKSNSTGGIIGGGYGSYGNTTIEVYDSVVDSCNVINKDIVSSTYSGSAGIVGKTIYGGVLKVDNCLINNCNIEATKHETQSGAFDQDVGGVLGMAWDSSGLEVTNCDVIDCDILSKATVNDSCANASAVIGACGYSSNQSTGCVYKVEECNVKNTSVTTDAGNLGGVFGMCYNLDDTLRIKDCYMEGVELYSTAGTSSSDSNSTTGGFLGNSFQDVEFINCDLSNSTVVGRGRNVGGIAAKLLSYDGVSTLKDCDVYNCTIKNEAFYEGRMYPLDTVAGIAGSVREAEFINCTVDKSIIYGKQVGNAAGIMGCSIGGDNVRTVTNCSVTNTDITSETEVADASSNSTVSGMMGRINNQTIKMYDCIVENCTFTGKGMIIAGVAASGQECVANNVTVKDVTINSNPTKGMSSTYGPYRSSGGFLGSFTGTSELENVKVENIEFNGETGTTGAIAGFLQGVDKLENCTVDGMTVDNNSQILKKTDSIGGLVGVINTINCTIKNNTVSDLTVEAEDSNIGGIIGTGFSSSAINIENCDISDFNLTNKNSSVTSTGYANVGGIVASTMQDFNLVDCDVTNGTLKIKEGINGNLSVGGLIGFASDTTAKDCNVSNVSISNETDGNAGGLVGMCNYIQSTQSARTLSVINSTVGNNTSISGVGHTGGLLGFGKIDVDSATVNSTTVKSTGSISGAGGIIGHSVSASDIENADVKNSTIIGNYQVGGIAGYTASDITNCDVIGTNVSTTNSSGFVGGIVGIAPESSSEITGCIVSSSSTITGVNGYTGGIVGFGNNTIDNCKVSDSIIKATGESAYGLGGIIGHGSNVTTTSTYVTNCSVSNCEITGVDAVGGIAGAAVPFIENCTVDGEEVELETAMELLSSKTLMIETANVDNSTEETKEETEITEEIEENKEETEDEVIEETVEETVSETEQETIEESVEETETEEITEETIEASVEETETEEITEETIEASVVETEIGEVTEKTEKVTEEGSVETQSEVVEEEIVQEEILENPTEEEISEETEIVEEITEEKVEETTEKNSEETEENEEEIITEEKLSKKIEKPLSLSSSSVQMLTAGEEVEKEYSTKITGRKFIGGIIGMGGQLYDTNTYVTITDCTLKGIQITGTEFVEDAIGKNSYYNATDTTIYDKIVNLIKETVNLIIE